MFYICRWLFSLLFMTGLLVPQVAVANFYVIPVGKSPIKTADVKHLITYDFGTIPPDTGTGVARTLRVLNPDGSQDGSPSGEYLIPLNKVFVITSLHVSPDMTASTGKNFFQIYRKSQADVITKVRDIVVSSTDTKEFNFVPGIVVEGNAYLQVYNRAESNTSIIVSLIGYETYP